jgi:hypothetical protein
MQIFILFFIYLFFAKHHITQLCQPPYSPDLAPCDFWLFPKLKSPLKGRRYFPDSPSISQSLNLWTASWKTKDSALSDSKHPTSRCSLFLAE